jgi:hypothetical protein
MERVVIEIISLSEGLEVISEPSQTKGRKFIMREAGGWTGIDNETGDAWTEHFESQKLCEGWLMNLFEMEDLENAKNIG